MSGRQMGSETVAYRHIEILLSLKKGDIAICHNIDIVGIMLSEINQTQKNIIQSHLCVEYKKEKSTIQRKIIKE